MRFCWLQQQRRRTGRSRGDRARARARARPLPWPAKPFEVAKQLLLFAPLLSKDDGRLKDDLSEMLVYEPAHEHF